MARPIRLKFLHRKRGAENRPCCNNAMTKSTEAERVPSCSNQRSVRDAAAIVEKKNKETAGVVVVVGDTTTMPDDPWNFDAIGLDYDDDYHNSLCNHNETTTSAVSNHSRGNHVMDSPRQQAQTTTTNSKSATKKKKKTKTSPRDSFSGWVLSLADDQQ